MQIYPGTDDRQIEADNGEEPSANATTAGKNLSSVQMNYFLASTIDLCIKTTIITAGSWVLDYHP